MGDFDLEGMLANTGADHFSLTHPAFFVLPALLLCYMLLTTVVLINLLIAQMSTTYEEMNEVAVDEWHFARAGLVLEFMEKSSLPPPFNLLVYFWRTVRKLFRLGGRRVTTDFALFMDSAQQLEAQRLEREATLRASKKLADANIERPPTADDVAKRFDAMEATLAKLLDKEAAVAKLLEKLGRD